VPQIIACPGGFCFNGLESRRRSTRLQAQVLTGSLFGVEAAPVRVEADVSGGLPRLGIVGLPDVAVREAAERVRAAIKRSGFEWPAGRITVNLAPASLRKAGAGLDLAIAVAILGASGVLPPGRLDDLALLGELSLSGQVRPVHGALAVARAVARAGTRRLVTAAGCSQEAALVAGLQVLPAGSLAEVVAYLKGAQGGLHVVRSRAEDLLARAASVPGPDMSDVRGQIQARRALEVAAAGGHNLLLYGPPGSGKTMLARRLSGLLPPPALEEALTITQIASCAGLGCQDGLMTSRPFRAPHHSVTPAGLIGGGLPPRPGEISLAHGGVLFLDELPEFGRRVLDLLRQPLEEGDVILSRGGRRAAFPACFQLVAAMNPCPCGYLGDPARPCTCTPHAVQRYRGRVSGPLLDRIDIHVEVPRPSPAALSGQPGEETAAVRRRVLVARAHQEKRQVTSADGQSAPAEVNGELRAGSLRRLCRTTPAGRRLLEQAMTTLALSARAHDAVLRVSRTLADLDGCEEIEAGHIAEAVSLRGLDRDHQRPG